MVPQLQNSTKFNPNLFRCSGSLVNKGFQSIIFLSGENGVVFNDFLLCFYRANLLLFLAPAVFAQRDR